MVGTAHRLLVAAAVAITVTAAAHEIVLVVGGLQPYEVHAALVGLAAALLDDAARLRWVARVRRGELPRVTLARAGDEHLELPTLWSLDYFAEEVLVESDHLAAGPYRSSPTRRVLARLSPGRPRAL